MARGVDTHIPTALSAGESLWAQISYTDYPATTHTATLFLDGPASVSVVASASGSDFLFRADGAITGAWMAGAYCWRIIATATASQLATQIDSGMLNVKGVDPRLAGATAALAAIEGMILSAASGKYRTMSLSNGMTVTTRDPAELIKWRQYYLNEVARLQRSLAVQLGQGSVIRKLSTRFQDAAPGQTLFPRIYP